MKVQLPTSDPHTSALAPLRSTRTLRWCCRALRQWLPVGIKTSITTTSSHHRLFAKRNGSMHQVATIWSRLEINHWAAWHHKASRYRYTMLKDRRRKWECWTLTSRPKTAPVELHQSPSPTVALRKCRRNSRRAHWRVPKKPR